MPSAPATASALLPVTIAHKSRRADLSIPGNLALVELLPGLVTSLDLLTTGTATQGFRVLRSDGTELDQSRPLLAQSIKPGDVLTLETAGLGVNDVRYDDIVEAVGTVVENTRAPWRRGDSIRLSAYAAVALFLAAAILVMVGQRGSWLAAGTMVGGSLLVGLTAAVVLRTSREVGPALSLVVTATLLLGAAGFIAADGGMAARSMWAGVGIAAGSVAAVLLPRGHRSVAAGPLAAGLLLILWGALANVAHVPLPVAGALVVTLATLMTLMAPWLAMAQAPVRIASSTADATLVPQDAQARVMVGDAGAMVLALRLAAGVMVALVAWNVAQHPAGAWLMVATAVAWALGTRALYGRSEVLVGVVTAIAVLLLAGASVVSHTPEMLVWVVVAAALAGAVVLANNVVNPVARPTLERLADACHVIALIALIPLTTLVWGLF